MLCERCYRHLLAPPLAVDADSLFPTSNDHLAPMSDQEVRFEEVLNVAQSQDEYVNYHGDGSRAVRKASTFRCSTRTSRYC